MHRSTWRFALLLLPTALLVMPGGVAADMPDTFQNLQVLPEDISKDELEHVLKQVQSATDDFVSKIDVIVSAKEQEILEVSEDGPKRATKSFKDPKSCICKNLKKLLFFAGF